MAVEIAGRVIGRQIGGEISELSVEAWVSDSPLDEPLSKTFVDSAGVFKMEVEEERLRELFQDPSPELYFRVFRSDELLVSTEGLFVWRLDDPPAEIEIEVDLSPDEETTKVTQREFVGRLLDQHGGVPLAGFTVRAFDLYQAAERKDLGSIPTDEDGIFSFDHTVPSRESGRADDVVTRLFLRVMSPEGDTIFDTEIAAEEGQDGAREIRIPVPAEPEPASPTLVDFSNTVDISLPPRILADLERRGIRNLADVRRAANIGTDGLAEGLDGTTLQKLTAHANLNQLSPDLQLNDALIHQGYTSIHDIAAVPRSDFIATARDRLGDFKAAQMHVAAHAQAAYLDSALVGLGTCASGAATTLDGNLDGMAIEQMLQDLCDCDGCANGASPVAYLADLLTYAQNHLGFSDEQQTWRINSDYLTENFHQPFADITASCESADTPVRQVRLCVEVLRRYLRSTQVDQADVDCSALPFPPKLAITGDVDGDGRDELIVAPDWSYSWWRGTGPEGGAFWVMDFDPHSSSWRHLSPLADHPFEADFDASSPLLDVAAKFALAADVDGDGRDEVVIGLDKPGAAGNSFWVMDYNPKTRSWQNLNSEADLPLGADFDCSDAEVAARFALAADVDGDGRDEIVIALDRSGAEGNNFWVMDYNPSTEQWQHLGSLTGAQFDADFRCTATYPYAAKFALAGDFDGDGRDEIAVSPDAPGNFGSVFWVMDFNSATGQWKHLNPNDWIDIDGDVNVGFFPYPNKFAMAGDVDGDGKDELIVAPTVAAGKDSNALYALRFNQASGTWDNVSPIGGHPLGADLDASAKPLQARFGLLADVDGDDRHEVVVAPTEGNQPTAHGLWVMDLAPGSANFQHLSPLPGHPLDSDVDWSDIVNPANYALRGDVDGDGRDELVIAPKYSSVSNNFWVMDYDPATKSWRHLSPIIRRIEQRYVLEAYRTLLAQIGTSFDEMRLARTAPAVERRALAERLGIDLDPQGSRPDHLDALLLEPEAITEASLEKLFGLTDTVRDPLSEGAKQGDPKGQLKRWQFSGIEWEAHPWANVSPDGNLYLKLTKLAGTRVRVGVFRDANRQSLVAAGERSTATGPVDIKPVLGSGLHGRVDIAYTTDTADIEVAVVPDLLAWRLRRLRALWHTQDWPDDAFDQDLLPIIDPDVIGVDDLRAPFAKPDPGDSDSAFDIWLNRRAWVDGQLDELASMTRVVDGQNEPDLAAMLDSMYAAITYGGESLVPWEDAPQPSDFDDLLEALTESTDGAGTETAIATVRDTLHLAVDGFTRLMELRAKGALAANDTGAEKLTAEEWREVRSILAQARKASFFAMWREEEKDRDVRLGTEEFWVSAREPAAGDWPPLVPDQQPLIDPETIAEHELPEPTAGTQAAALWRARLMRLAQIKKALKLKRESSGVEPLLVEALGQPPANHTWQQDLGALRDDLSSDTPTDVVNARATIAGLGVTEDAFGRLMGVIDKSTTQTRPSPAEWDEAYGILTSARKVRQEFPNWIAEEDRNLKERQAEPSAAYWRALKAKLPRWRASAEARHTWQQALRARSRPPVIDPDLVSFTDLKRLSPGDAAYDVWKPRSEWVRNRLEDLSYKREAISPALGAFDAVLVECVFGDDTVRRFAARLGAAREAEGLTFVLQRIFGDPLPDLDQLRVDLTGTDLAAREKARGAVTRTHYLTVENFERLMTIRDLGEANVSAAQWDEAYAILARAALVKSVMSLGTAERRGEDIAVPLEQYGLSRAAYAHLERTRDLLASGTSVIDPEWEGVYSILIQIQKQRRFAEWRDKEREANVVLGPDYFVLPPTDHSAIPESPSLPAWRATRRARRDWENTLESRVEQEQTVAEALRDAVGVVEEATLPSLRDALLLATDLAGSAVESRAKWFTDHFLIDARTSGCQMTTRLNQASETVRGVLQAVRTGQLIDTHPTLELHAQNFDEEWKWLETYAAWRAAMSVNHYPENVLLPTLRPRQTPAFLRLSKALRSTGSLTSQRAWEIAEEYAAYFRDVTSLQLEACVEAITSGASSDCRTRASGGERRLLHLFARSSLSNRVYWSVLDQEPANPEHAQSFWDGMQGLPRANNLIGAVVYRPPGHERFLYLFASIGEGGDQKLVFMRYGLDSGGPWSAEPLELDLPEGATEFTARLRQTRLDEPPHLGIWLTNGDIYSRRLNHQGIEWEAAAFQSLYSQGKWRNLSDLDFSSLDHVAKKETTVTGDFDGDGREEIAAASLAPGSLGNDFWIKGFDNGIWEHMSPIEGHGMEADLDFSGEPYEAMFAVTGDFDGDGRDEIAVAYEVDFSTRNEMWVRDYDPGSKSWSPLGQNAERTQDTDDPQDTHQSRITEVICGTGHPFQATWAVTGDFDGDGRDEIAVAVQNEKPEDNYDAQVRRLWVLDLVEDSSGKRWVSLGIQQEDTSGAQMVFDPHWKKYGISEATTVTGDFDGDGRDEIALAINASGTLGNDFWVIKYDSDGDVWRHLSPSTLHGEGAEVDFSGSDYKAKFALSGDFDNDGRDEIAVALVPPEDDASEGNKFWIQGYNPATCKWQEKSSFKCSDLDYAAKFAVAGDFDGDGRDEIAVRIDASGTLRNDFWVMEFDPPSSSWKHLSPLCGNAVEADFDCSDANDPVDGVSIGDFDGDGRAEVAAQRSAAGTLGNDFWVMDYDVVLDGWLAGCDHPNITPYSEGTYALVQRPLEADLMAWREQGRIAYLSNRFVSRTHLTYAEEAFYFVPLQIALQLQRGGHYTDALDWFRLIYDYSRPPAARLIYTGLRLEQNIESVYSRSSDWLLDPINPHAIAATRAKAYTRYTLLSLVRCFLDFADAEFTRDTSESVAQARTLYITALELLDQYELGVPPDACEVADRDLGAEESGPQAAIPISLLKRALNEIKEPATRRSVAAEVNAVMSNGEELSARFARARDIVSEARAGQPQPPRLSDLLQGRGNLTSRAHAVLLARPEVAETSSKVGDAAAEDFLRGVARASGVSAAALTDGPVQLTWLREPVAEKPEADGTTWTLGADDAMRRALTIGPSPISGSVNLFCIPPNPLARALRLRAELNLHKLRNCLNIAGMRRQLELYSTATSAEGYMPVVGADGQLVLPGATRLRPTPYRYAALVERAKHLVQLANQLEGAMLSALEKRDAELYNLLKARQDLRLAYAGVQLQELRFREAEGGVGLAELQEERAYIQANHYQDLLREPVSTLEHLSLALAASAAATQWVVAGYFWYQAGLTLGAKTIDALSATAPALQSTSAYLSTLASLERRQQDWEFQRDLAQQDVRIGTQQIGIAEDHVRVVEQERSIAGLQAEHAEAIADFLTKKFGNAELYDWMSNILQGVYSFFLQQATGVAQLAASQLAFERHEMMPPVIQADYWEAPADGALDGTASEGRVPDRRGLTGSARLMQDIYQLDQYAFETDKRKLQLTKTISLAQLSPVEFQRFRETGVMTFATPMELFDRDFPGHYLRLIKRVRTSVVALIPPTQGIRATLATTGTSRVVIGGEVHQSIVVRRHPEMVALSSPREATGLFELEQQSELLMPFEGVGVDTTWEFRMPKAANQFDYGTIADVLFTIEYTALNSFDHQQRVIQELGSDFGADRAFSFRHELADQWYDFHNPDQTPEPMVVRFATSREDFPPNIPALKIEHVVLYFARSAEQSFEVPVSNLRFKPRGSAGAVGGGATSVGGVISTRRGNASSWIHVIGHEPVGEWELSLKADDPVKDKEIRELFKNEEIEDILFVITYSGRTPEWPG